MTAGPGAANQELFGMLQALGIQATVKGGGLGGVGFVTQLWDLNLRCGSECTSHG